MLDLTRFEMLSFDCYGTLIDWEAGILGALRPILGRRGLSLPDEELLGLMAELEAAAEAGPYRRYATVLDEVVAGIGARLGFTPEPEERASLAASMKRWRPFEDSVESLRALKRRYRLAIISNVDDDLFAATAAALEVSFDEVVTAEQVGSYKPSPENFRRALERFGLPPGRLLHVAQSLFHDIGPASSLGIATVHIDRRRGRAGTGATPPAAARADLVLPDLRSLARLAAGGTDPGGLTPRA